MDRRMLTKLVVEASQLDWLEAVNRLIRAFVPHDPDIYGVALPLRLGWIAYREIHAVFFHIYEVQPESQRLIADWFIYDDSLEDLQAEWSKIFPYEEYDNLKSHIATSRPSWGGRRKRLHRHKKRAGQECLAP